MSKLKYFLLSQIAVAIFHGAKAACPNACSGHGYCGIGNVCTCFTGWNGGAADCSFRQCPTGPAWADKPYALNSAHQISECSNAGACDRSSGICACFPGFSGNACHRLNCNNDCSGHGSCYTLQDMSVFYGPDYDNDILHAGDGLGTEYLNWDKSSVTMCECDWGYFGADCSLTMCPKGDDPITIDQNYRGIRVYLSSDQENYFAGSIGLEFEGKTAWISLDTIPSSDSCIKALAATRSFGFVGCNFGSVYNYVTLGIFNWYLDIFFYSWPTYPQQNNIYSHDGNPLLSEFYCDVSRTVAGISCTFSDLANSNLREYSYCSNRGVCDFNTGRCSCTDGFGGPACSNLTSVHIESTNELPGVQVNIINQEYISTAVQMRTSNTASKDFYFIEAIADEERMFYVRGDGSVFINRMITQDHGQTILSGGLEIMSGGLSIMADGLNVYSASTISPIVSLTSSHSGNLLSNFTAVEISSASSSTSHFLLTASNQGVTRFAVRADGATFVNSGGLYVTQGVTVSTGGLTVRAGITVLSGGMFVYGGLSIAGGGLVVSTGATVATGGLAIISGGLAVNAGGATIANGGLKISGGGLNVISGACTVSGGMTIYNAGLRVTGGISIHVGGLSIIGDSTLTGTLSVSSDTTIGGALSVASSLTVSSFLNVGASATMGGSLSVVAAAALGSSLAVQGTLSVAGASTLTSLHISNSLTVGSSVVMQSTLSVAGSMTGASTMSVANGITTSTLSTTGTAALQSLSVGTTVTVSGNVIISGGLSVNGGTVYLANGYTTSDRRLKTDIVPLVNPLGKIANLRGVYFSWMANSQSELQFDDKRHLGLIAQDVQRVLPELVEAIQGGKYLGVDYMSFIPLLVEGVRELDIRTKASTIAHKAATETKKTMNIKSEKLVQSAEDEEWRLGNTSEQIAIVGNVSEKTSDIELLREEFQATAQGIVAMIESVESRIFQTSQQLKFICN